MSSTRKTQESRAHHQQFAHCHVPAFMSLPWTRLDNTDNDDIDSSSSPMMMIQVIHDGSFLTVENLCANTTTTTNTTNASTTSDNDNEQNMKQHAPQQKQKQPKDATKLSLRQPMLILDTPESIGMTLPTVPGSSSKKRGRNNDNDDNDKKKFSIRHVADLLDYDFAVRVINVQNQQELPDWTLGDMVDYFTDEERLLRNAAAAAYNNSNNDNNSSKNATGNAAGDDTKMQAPSPQQQRRPVRRAAARASVVNQKQQQDYDDDDDEMPLVINQISLEFSHTPLRNKVRSPQFVRDLDWIDQAWRFPQQQSIISSSNNNNNGHTKKTKTKSGNKNNNNRSRYPAVQYYCLTSAAGCYTDFHVDFGGSSVWYHVLTGEKHFCLIPPTPQNLQLYEEWLCSPTQAQDFLPHIIQQHQNQQQQQQDKDEHDQSTSDEKSIVYKIALKEQQTLIIPAGWIHCVYTPIDSLVFGGNFLHGFDIDLQLHVYSIEVRSRVLEQYRFPMFIQVHFAAASMYLHLLQHRDPRHRRPSLVEIQSLGRLIEAVTMWWNPTTATTTTDSDDESISLSAVARQVAAEHDCATFQDFLTLLQQEHERALAEVQQQQNHHCATMVTTPAAAAADNDDDKEVQKEHVDVGKSATSPRLRVKLSSSSRSSSSKVVVMNETEPSKDESKASSTTGLDDIDSDDKFRIEVSASSRQGRTVRRRAKVEFPSVNDNDEWLPSSEKKQQPRRREKEPSPSVNSAASSSNGQMSPPPPGHGQKQQTANKRTKKTETKATTARQRLLKKVGR